MARDQPDLVIAPEAPNRRALVLPGGGMRVAYQAGAVKALYDSGLRFSFADGASGGTMNLAALLSGITPDDLCRRWRGLNPVSFVSPRPLRAYFGFPVIGAFGDFDGIQHKVFPQLPHGPLRQCRHTVLVAVDSGTAPRCPHPFAVASGP